MAKPTGKPNGRPPKLRADEETLKSVRGLAQIHATYEDAAAFFHVNERTFRRFLKKKIVRETYEEGLGEGRISLRRLQFKIAQKSASMAIFLGKQYLGQTDKQEFSGKDGAPIQVAGSQSVIVIHDNGRDRPPN